MTWRQRIWLIIAHIYFFIPGNCLALIAAPESTEVPYLYSKIRPYLPDTLAYGVRYSILGFKVAPGGKVQDLNQINKVSPYISNWSIYRTVKIEKTPDWTFDYSVSPVFSSYLLNQQYDFLLRGQNSNLYYLSRYRIELLRINALLSTMIEVKIPNFAFQAGIGAGPCVIFWKDSNGVHGTKIELTWGPQLAAWFFIWQNLHLKATFEVFSITRNQPIGTSAYYVNAYQYASVSLGWRLLD